jgi:urease accessory protein
VGSAAGPIGGDRFDLSVRVARGASLELRAAAATLVLPGPTRDGTGCPSTIDQRVCVEEGAVLRWSPEPQILVAGCDHRVTSEVDLAPDASLVWKEEVVLGRHGEPTGSLLQGLRVDRAGRPLVRSELPVGPRWPGSSSAAGLGAARAVGSLLVVGPLARMVVPPIDDRPNGIRAAVMELADDAVVVNVVGPRPDAVRRALAAAMPTQAEPLALSAFPNPIVRVAGARTVRP